MAQLTVEEQTKLKAQGAFVKSKCDYKGCGKPILQPFVFTSQFAPGEFCTEECRLAATGRSVRRKDKATASGGVAATYTTKVVSDTGTRDRDFDGVPFRPGSSMGFLWDTLRDHQKHQIVELQKGMEADVRSRLRALESMGKATGRWIVKWWTTEVQMVPGVGQKQAAVVAAQPQIKAVPRAPKAKRVAGKKNKKKGRR